MEPTNIGNFWMSFFGENSLQYLIFQDNNVQEFEKQISIVSPNPNVSLAVDFSRNKLTKLDPNIFQESIDNGLRITALILSENSFVGQTDVETFKLYKHLTHLDLSSNRINSLPWSYFRKSKSARNP